MFPWARLKRQQQKKTPKPRNTYFTRLCKVLAYWGGGGIHNPNLVYSENRDFRNKSPNTNPSISLRLLFDGRNQIHARGSSGTEPRGHHKGRREGPRDLSAVQGAAPSPGSPAERRADPEESGQISRLLQGGAGRGRPLASGTAARGKGDSQPAGERGGHSGTPRGSHPTRAKVYIPRIILANVFSSPLSSTYTIFTLAEGDTGLPTCAP